MTITVNFPDVLGAITGGARINQGVVQVASALRPRVIMAGRSVEMLLLLQNMSNVEVQIVTELRLPSTDAKKQKGRIIAKSDALAVRLSPGAVGVIVLPLATLPDIAVSAGYPIGMEVKVTPVGSKPQRVRTPDGGEPFEVETLPAEKRELVEDLKKLAWTANGKGGVVESALTVMSGKVGALPDLQASFTTIWTPVDTHADAYLLMLLGDVVYHQVLPALKRPNILPVMQEYTAKRFFNVGYELRPEEIDGIARYFTYLLECAAPGEKQLVDEERARHNLRIYFNSDGTVRQDLHEVRLPHWLRELARVAFQDARVMQLPVKAIGHFAYDGLLRDALHDAFHTVEALLQMELGTAAEHEAYIEVIFDQLREKKLTFEKLYLPLMMGAIVHGHTVTVRTERPADVLNTLRDVAEQRGVELDEDSRGVQHLVIRLCDIVAQRYGAMPD
ncbi:hypothetical protein VZO05_15480 [Aggregatilineales bacterium SYSU G02658]